jgi:predicted Fe-Mo cluster-binding NifX family protein
MACVTLDTVFLHLLFEFAENLRSMKIAVATMENDTLAPKHFGEVRYFELIEYKDRQITRLECIPNTQSVHGQGQHDHIHGDHGKAKGIVQLLQAAGAELLIGRQFGPNIRRVCAHFGILLTGSHTINELMGELLTIGSELETGVQMQANGCYPVLRMREDELQVVTLKQQG